MALHPYYKTKEWGIVELETVKAHKNCGTPGCGGRSVKAIHVVPIESGGSRDYTHNIRAVCKSCYDQWRASLPKKPKPIRGVFADGTPRDPNHPWYKGGNGQG